LLENLVHRDIGICFATNSVVHESKYFSTMLLSLFPAAFCFYESNSRSSSVHSGEDYPQGSWLGCKGIISLTMLLSTTSVAWCKTKSAISSEHCLRDYWQHCWFCWKLGETWSNAKPISWIKLC